MKKALLLGAIVSLLVLQTAFAYSYDRDITWQTKHGTYTIHRHVTGTVGEGYTVRSKWYKDNDYKGVVVREVEWERHGNCAERETEGHYHLANGKHNEWTNSATWCN